MGLTMISRTVNLSVQIIVLFLQTNKNSSRNVENNQEESPKIFEEIHDTALSTAILNNYIMKISGGCKSADIIDLLPDKSDIGERLPQIYDRFNYLITCSNNKIMEGVVTAMPGYICVYIDSETYLKLQDADYGSVFYRYYLENGIFNDGINPMLLHYREYIAKTKSESDPIYLYNAVNFNIPYEHNEKILIAVYKIYEIKLADGATSKLLQSFSGSVDGDLFVVDENSVFYKIDFKKVLTFNSLSLACTDAAEFLNYYIPITENTVGKEIITEYIKYASEEYKEKTAPAVLSASFGQDASSRLYTYDYLTLKTLFNIHAL